MATLNVHDVNYVLNRLPKDVLNRLMHEPLFLAGGFIRAVIANEEVSDIDIFGKGDITSIAEGLAADWEGKAHYTGNAVTVLAPPRTPVQFITRWQYPTAEELMSKFDFTIVQAVIWREDDKWHSLCADSFYMDLAAKRLVYTNPQRDEEVGGSLLRAIKYTKRGYRIQMPSLAAVVVRLLRGTEFESPIQNVDQDTATHVVSGLLREVDPMNVVDGLELIDDHKVHTYTK